MGCQGCCCGCGELLGQQLEVVDGVALGGQGLLPALLTQLLLSLKHVGKGHQQLMKPSNCSGRFCQGPWRLGLLPALVTQLLLSPASACT